MKGLTKVRRYSKKRKTPKRRKEDISADRQQSSSLVESEDFVIVGEKANVGEDVTTNPESSFSKKLKMSTEKLDEDIDNKYTNWSYILLDTTILRNIIKLVGTCPECHKYIISSCGRRKIRTFPMH